jgi:parB protein
MARRDVDVFALLDGQLSKVSDSDTNGREQIQYIDLELLDADEANFYSIKGIHALAANIELCGLQQPLRVRPAENGRYKVVSGHRRRAALKSLAAENPEKWRQAACIVEHGDESPAMRELRLILANSDTRQLTPAEISKQAERVERLLYQLKEEGVVFPGRMRDQVAAACKVSATKLGVLKVIRENLVPSYLELFNAGKLPESSAYALARMPDGLQEDIFAACKEKLNSCALDQYRKQVQEGLPKQKEPLRCPDSQKPCTHYAAFLRHDCNNAWDQCYGAICCMECDRAMREWSPCASACSKAKAAKSAKLAAKKQKEEKRKEKEAAKNQIASEPVAAFWRRIQDAAKGELSDRELISLTNGASYYHDDIRHMMDGTFKATEYNDGHCTYPTVDHFRKFCLDHQVSADALLELPAADQPEGQLTIAGWMPGGTDPAEPGDFAVLVDFGGGYFVHEFYSWNGTEWIFSGGEAEDLPSWWMRLPPVPEVETCEKEELHESDDA